VIRRHGWILHLSLSVFAATVFTAVRAEGRIASRLHDIDVKIITDRLEYPWGLAFLPGGDMLVTERGGTLRRVNAAGEVSEPLTGLPDIREKGQGGLLGIALHPQFRDNRWLYLSYTGRGDGGYGTEVLRGRLSGNGLEDTRVIFRARDKSGGGRHFGSRLVFAEGGRLYISLGDRGKRDTAQDLNDHRGSLVRLNDDGSVPAGNPFTGQADARPEIFSYGHRNIQGMAVHPRTGNIWTHEHGPQGGDEINIISAGLNYGWPVITYGVNYGIGTKIGEGTHRPGMQQPLYKWVPSIAPSGMAFYEGERFPRWRGDLFVGSLKFGLLVRLDVEVSEIVGEERMLDNRYGRIRDVVSGPDGYLYLLTDESSGKLLKLGPAQRPQ